MYVENLGLTSTSRIEPRPPGSLSYTCFATSWLTIAFKLTTDLIRAIYITQKLSGQKATRKQRIFENKSAKGQEKIVYKTHTFTIIASNIVREQLKNIYHFNDPINLAYLGFVQIVFDKFWNKIVLKNVTGQMTQKEKGICLSY